MDRNRVSLVLPESMRRRMEEWACRSHPREACGLLLGRRGEVRTEVADVLEARNLVTTRASERYELDPADHLAAEERARRLGLDVVGVWHSHPDHPAVPSEVDRAQAWEAWVYVIVSVVEGAACELRAWRLVGERFVEVEVQP
jgi:proteasome lid subunit RPN8/RPN11